MIRLKTVNKHLPEGVELVIGEGYLYFIGGNTASWESASVYTMRLNDYTLEEWLDHYDNMLKTYEAEVPKSLPKSSIVSRSQSILMTHFDIKDSDLQEGTLA